MKPKLFHKMVYDKPKAKRHYKLIGLSALLLIGLVSFVSIYVASKVNDFFTENYLQFNDVLKMEWSYPVEVKKREMISPQVVQIVLQYPGKVDTPIKRYICDKFGVYECQTALAIAEAESKFNELATNLNGGKSLDLGIFQINQVHWKRPGCSLKELVDAYKNVDCAHSIWKEQGWTPWVAFLNKSFVNFIK
jgi:hypothetical protein